MAGQNVEVTGLALASQKGRLHVSAKQCENVVAMAVQHGAQKDEFAGVWVIYITQLTASNVKWSSSGKWSSESDSWPGTIYTCMVGPGCMVKDATGLWSDVPSTQARSFGFWCPFYQTQHMLQYLYTAYAVAVQ